MLMKKGGQVHGAKFDTLGAESQNVNLPAKMLKIAIFRPGPPPQHFKKFSLFFKDFSLEPFRNFQACLGMSPRYHPYISQLQKYVLTWFTTFPMGHSSKSGIFKKNISELNFCPAIRNTYFMPISYPQKCITNV